jgi:hypothetical protein
VETIEQAIRTLQKTEQQTSWRKHLPHLERALHVELVDQYRNWTARINRLMLGRQPHDLIALKRALEELERFEHDTARIIADRMLPHPRLSYLAGDQADFMRARAQHAKDTEQRNAHIAEAVAELVAVNNLKRPAALTEAIRAAQQRLQVSK